MPSRSSSEDILSFDPPSADFILEVDRFFQMVFAPRFFGLEHVDPKRPAMYVGNHTIYGILDGTPFGIELFKQHGIILRSLADSNHFYVKAWADLVKRMGMVEASRSNCAKLMEGRQHILVYPGGTREICKKKGEEYKLLWNDRTGFVRMALEYGYDIIPVAAVGAEEAFTIVKDSDEIMQSSLGKFLKWSGIADKYLKGGALIPPLVKGIGNSIFPRPERLYFSFGKRISTRRYKKRFEEEEVQLMFRKKVEDSLHHQFGELFSIREKDKPVSFIHEWLKKQKK